MKLQIKKLNSEAQLPSYGNEFAAGLDIYSIKNMIVPANGYATVGTGLSIKWVAEDEFENPNDYYFHIFPRSGLAHKFGINVSGGVIDSDYRGEICVILHNSSNDHYKVNIGDRVAQGILTRFKRVIVEEVFELDETERGDKGFGSSGV